MIEDLNDIDTSGEISADIAIIGAGAAGITLALKLASPSRRVILLESGGEEYDPAVQKLYEGHSTGVPYGPLDIVRLRYLGGSTNHWGGWCRPLESCDFEAHPDLPLSGWPFGLETLQPYYDAARPILELGSKGFDATLPLYRAARGDRMIQGAWAETKLFQFSPPTRFGQRYHEDLSSNPNIRLILNATVREIKLAENGESVSKLDVTNLAGKHLSVTAKHYVLAAGGIENARILLYSNSIQPDGVGNAHGWVGRCFMEHPILLNAATMLITEPDGLAKSYVEQVATGDMNVRATLKPPEKLRRRHSLGGMLATLEQPEIFDPATSKNIEMADIFRNSGTKSATGVTYRVSLGMEQRPNPDSRITLAEDTDALGLPRINLAWHPTAEDKESLRQNLMFLGRQLGAQGIGRLRLNITDDGDWPADLTWGNHHMGTTRMAENPKKGVCDANASVHGIKNLSIAGSSLFPTVGAANPTFTLTALALKLADYLAGKMP